MLRTLVRNFYANYAPTNSTVHSPFSIKSNDILLLTLLEYISATHFIYFILFFKYFIHLYFLLDCALSRDQSRDSRRKKEWQQREDAAAALTLFSTSSFIYTKLRTTMTSVIKETQRWAVCFKVQLPVAWLRQGILKVIRVVIWRIKTWLGVHLCYCWHHQPVGGKYMILTGGKLYWSANL